MIEPDKDKPNRTTGTCCLLDTEIATEMLISSLHFGLKYMVQTFSFFPCFILQVVPPGMATPANNLIDLQAA
jgi:hypothetical protein